jgi:hypothetical protein
LTATVQDVLHVALSQVGYHETGGPHGNDGNITKFWAELAPGYQGSPWCAAFIRWTDKHAGGPLLPISNPYYCPSIETYARQHGLLIPAAQLSPGDYYLCDFTGQGVAEHIGRATAAAGLGYVHGVEGNTSPDSVGSQANGGGVYEKVRPLSVIRYGVDYSKLLAHVAPRNAVKRNPFHPPATNLSVGCTSDRQSRLTRVHWVQWAVGVPCDGVYGHQTDHAVQLFQHYHHLRVDGVVGPATRAALARVTH